MSGRPHHTALIAAAAWAVAVLGARHHCLWALLLGCAAAGALGCKLAHAGSKRWPSFVHACRMLLHTLCLHMSAVNSCRLAASRAHAQRRSKPKRGTAAGLDACCCRPAAPAAPPPCPCQSHVCCSPAAARPAAAATSSPRPHSTPRSTRGGWWSRTCIQQRRSASSTAGELSHTGGRRTTVTAGPSVCARVGDGCCTNRIAAVSPVSRHGRRVPLPARQLCCQPLLAVPPAGRGCWC